MAKSTVHNIINDLYKNVDLSYLELGLSCGTNFNSLQTNNKKSVDVKSNNGSSPTFLMSTDQFFEKNTEKFHIIYIDADHEHGQVIKDYNNSVESIFVNGVIFLHDLYPPDENHTQRHFCDTSYKVLNYFLDNNFDVLVNLEDYGSCAVFNNKKIDIEKFDSGITYQNFVKKYSASSHQAICNSYTEFLNKYKTKLTIA